MANEMVDRVARQLAADPAPGDYDEVPVDEVFTRPRYAHLKQMYERQARDALDVTRVPTEAQLNAARDWSHAKYGKPIGNEAAIGCWQAMIDAVVLKE